MDVFVAFVVVERVAEYCAVLRVVVTSKGVLAVDSYHAGGVLGACLVGPSEQNAPLGLWYWSNAAQLVAVYHSMQLSEVFVEALVKESKHHVGSDGVFIWCVLVLVLALVPLNANPV